MSWTEEKVNKLKELWGKGQTASQIATIIGGISRNAVIGKAHRLNLSAKIKTRVSTANNNSSFRTNESNNQVRGRKNRLKALLLDKNFEPSKNLKLEDLTEQTCKYMEGHPDEKESSFCGRNTVEKFSYCPLHLMIVFQPKGKKEEVVDKEDDVPQFIEKKIKNKRKKLNTLDVDNDKPLKGKLIIQMYEKQSSRTRLSFHLSIAQLGGESITIKANEMHLGKGGETLADTAKILSTYGDGFMLRTDNDKKIDDFRKNLTIPIINLLSPNSHPCQVLSDIFTVEEVKKKPISKLDVCWIGDCNNVLNSLIATSVKFKFNLNVACPKSYRPQKFVMNWVKKNKRKINFFNDPKKAVENVDVIFSDKVVSLNDKVNKAKKIKDFKNYRINSSLMKKTKKNSTIFLHCLPRGNEVSEDVFLGKNSKVWLQALNRIHVQKSILLYCFDKLR